MADELRTHQTLSQNGYEYVEFLGKGGFSNVLLCHNKKYCHPFAIKKAIKHKLTKSELTHLINLNHPHIIRIYDTFEDEFSNYLVMEYCSNGTIKDKGNLSYDKFVYYAKQILSAVAFCHSNNIAHRDIKPDNIFLDQYDHAKLGDFGMAKKFQDNEKSNEKCGSLLFTAPEMHLYQEICPFKADIWALGITFFYMATGQYPFQATTREQMIQMISRGEIDYNYYPINPKIRFLLKKMTSKNSENRLSAEKLLELPIFTSENSKLPGLLVRDKSALRFNLSIYRTPSKLNLNQSESEIKTGNETERTNLDLNTYRNINALPMVRRAKTHFLPSKTF